MTTTERRANLARGRRTAAKNRKARERQQAREHRGAARRYATARDDYYRTRRIHEEGSPAERKAFRRMLAAEVDWFNSHPGDVAA